MARRLTRTSLVFLLAGVFAGGALQAQSVVDQEQTLFGDNISNFDNVGLAQSFRPSQDNISGAALYVRSDPPGMSADITISVYQYMGSDGPTTMLATGTVHVTGIDEGWVRVSYTSAVPVTPGSSLYLDFSAANVEGGTLSLAGSVTNPYPDGSAYAQYESWPYTPYISYDYAFRTYYLPDLLTVTIDIKPGDENNSVNLNSNGVVPVAILSAGGFDATMVDPETVVLAGSTVAIRGKGDKWLSHVEDVNGDGDMDLVVQVETENLVPEQIQEGVATLMGSTFGGQAIQGTGLIRIVPPE